MFVGLTAAYALAHTMLSSFSFPALPLFTLIGILFGEWAEPDTRSGTEATASLRTRRMWHYVPAGAIGWVVFSAAVVAAMRPLPEAGLLLTELPLQGIEYNSVRNNVYIGLWGIGMAGLIAFAWYATAMVRSAEPAPAPQPTAEADRVTA